MQAQRAELLSTTQPRSHTIITRADDQTTKQQAQIDALLKDMVFISTYGVRLDSSAINKNSLTWDDFLHTFQVSIFGGLFAKLSWIMGEALLPTIVKLSMFWTISAVDIVKSVRLWFAYAGEKHGLTGMLLLGIVLTGVFLAVGLFAAIMTTLEATGKFSLTAIALPIIFTTLVSSVLFIKIHSAIKHFGIGLDEDHYTEVVRNQHKSHAWESVFDALTMVGVGLGVVSMFLLPALGLIATAPFWAPIVVPIVIGLGLILKLSLKIFNFFKGPVETITLDTNVAKQVPVRKDSWEGHDAKEEDSPENSLHSNGRNLSSTRTISDASGFSSLDSDISASESAQLLGREPTDVSRKTSAFFYTRRRVEDMGRLGNLREQKDYLTEQIGAFEARENLSQAQKAFLSELRRFVNNQNAVSIRTILDSTQKRNTAFKESEGHHESDMQDLTKAAVLFAHERSRVADKQDYLDYAPAYRMTLA